MFAYRNVVAGEATKKNPQNNVNSIVWNEIASKFMYGLRGVWFMSRSPDWNMI